MDSGGILPEGHFEVPVDLIERNPNQLHISLRHVEPTTGYKIMFVKKFDQGTSKEVAITWAHANGYRLAFPWESMAFARASPHLQIQVPFWIVDLGSYVWHDGVISVPIFSSSANGTNLVYCEFGSDMVTDYPFLFIRV